MTPEEVSDEVLKQAISTRFSECYGALRIANAISGTQTEKWQLLHNNTTERILNEADVRNIDWLNLLVAIPNNQFVKDSENYKKYSKQVNKP